MFAVTIDNLETETTFIHGTEFVTWNRISHYNQGFFSLSNEPSIDQGFTGSSVFQHGNTVKNQIFCLL